MEGADKPLTREALVSMQVIDARGRLLGQVKDVVFAVGKSGIALSVENSNGETQTISWEEVQAASDYIVLKPAAQSKYQQPQTAQPAQQQTSQPLCPTCGKPLTWIPQYQRWYCYTDKKYA